MDDVAGDSTQDWLLPEHSRPPLIGELERRIEEALATARASEAAVVAVGAAALDAAEQARRAADLAERASRAVFAPAVAPPPAPAVPVADGEPAAASRGSGESDGLGEFSQRADRLVARLQRLQRLPLGGRAASDASARPQPAY